MAYSYQYGEFANDSEKSTCELLANRLPEKWVLISNFGTGFSAEVDALIITDNLYRTDKQRSPIIFALELKNYSKVYREQANNGIMPFRAISKQVDSNSYSIKNFIKTECLVIPMIIITVDDPDLTELDDTEKEIIKDLADLSDQSIIETFKVHIERFIQGKLFKGMKRPYQIEQISLVEALLLTKELSERVYDSLCIDILSDIKRDAEKQDYETELEQQDNVRKSRLRKILSFLTKHLSQNENIDEQDQDLAQIQNKIKPFRTITEYNGLEFVFVREEEDFSELTDKYFRYKWTRGRDDEVRGKKHDKEIIKYHVEPWEILCNCPRCEARYITNKDNESHIAKCTKCSKIFRLEKIQARPVFNFIRNYLYSALIQLENKSS